MDREQVAHELRTPLTTIKGVLNLLSSGRLQRLPSEISAELVGRARNQLQVLEAVIERIEDEFEQPHSEDQVIVLYEEAVDA